MSRFQNNDIYFTAYTSLYHTCCSTLSRFELEKTASYNNGQSSSYSTIFKSLKDDLIADHYVILSFIGGGTFSEVFVAYDLDRHRKVALKVFKRIGEYMAHFHEETYYLDYISEQYKKKPNPILRMYDNFVYEGYACIVLQLLGNDLNKELEIVDSRGFRLVVVKRIVRSLLSTLRHLKKLQIIHGDLKPCNIAMSSNIRKTVKIIDYGSSCFEQNTSSRYFQTLFYRAPEVILKLQVSTAIDVWSTGVIATELYSGNPIFIGSNEEELMAAIIEILGVPPLEMINQSPVRSQFFDEQGNPLYRINNLNNIFQGRPYGAPGSRDLDTIFDYSKSWSYVDFLKRCFKWIPDERVTPQQAVAHPWLCAKTRRSMNKNLKIRSKSRRQELFE